MIHTIWLIPVSDKAKKDLAELYGEDKIFLDDSGYYVSEAYGVPRIGDMILGSRVSYVNWDMNRNKLVPYITIGN